MFPTTRHTLLHRVAGPNGREPSALNVFSELYWRPCCRYLALRFRMGSEEAQDLTQSFFAMLLEQNVLERYDEARGPFRPYLRACLDKFVAKQWERACAQKRGGGGSTLPLDDRIPERGEQNPDAVFEREWRRETFARAIRLLETHCKETGRELRFTLFAAYDLTDGTRPSYEVLAAQHGISLAAVTNHLAWARRELRRLLASYPG